MSFPTLGDFPDALPASFFSLCSTPPQAGFYLARVDGLWALCHSGEKPFFVDFASAYYRHRGGTEFLPKAFKGMVGAHLFDGTAGWARDSWLLAYRGFKLTLCERHPALFVLLEQAVQQARRLPLTAAVAERITVIFGESADVLCARASDFDAVYLDPMYPQREKSAKVKKDMQILHALLATDANNGDALLCAAQMGGANRIVVKRPKGAPFLADKKPHHSLHAPNTRFDIYV